MTRLPRFLLWLSGALAAVSVLTAIFVSNGIGQAHIPLTYPSSWPQISSSPNTKPVHMILLQVNDVKQRYVAGLLLIKSGNKVAIADLDSHVTIDLRTRGQFDLRRASHEVTSPELVQALNVAGGIAVDGALVFRDIGLAALVDGVGGITLTSATRIRLTPRGVTPVEYLSPGTHKVKGEIAANYALNSAPLNSNLAKSRLRTVVTTLLDSLPNNVQELEQLLSALGQSGRSSLTTSEVATFFAQSQGKWHDAVTMDVPTILALHPSQPEWKLIDVELMRSLMRPIDRSLLWEVDGARLGDQYRLLVQGASADREKTQELLSQGSIFFVDGGQASVPKESVLYVTGGISDSVLNQLKETLNLPMLRVQSVVSLPSGADMQLDVGVDFHNLHVEIGQ